MISRNDQADDQESYSERQTDHYGKSVFVGRVSLRSVRCLAHAEYVGQQLSALNRTMIIYRPDNAA